jgi:hypothetical protein
VCVLAAALALWLSGCDNCLVSACAEGRSPPVVSFEVTLTGDRVVPPVTTMASGSARFDLIVNSSGEPYAMRYSITVSNLTDAGSAAFYVGNSGTNGTPTVTLCSPCNTTGAGVTGGTAPVSPEVVDAMRAFGTYVEVRTASGPVLRGQLRVVGSN